jgi:hypothetical protein
VLGRVTASVVQLIGRDLLHRFWMTLAVLRGLPQPLPECIHRDLVLLPLLRCTREVLNSLVAAPGKNHSAYVAEIRTELPRRRFRRLHDQNFTFAYTSNVQTRHCSVVRVLSSIYSDCTAVLHRVQDLLFHMECSCELSAIASVEMVDAEFHKRSKDIHKLISKHVHRTVWVRKQLCAWFCTCTIN